MRQDADEVFEVVTERTRVPPLLVTGATGRVGRVVVDLLIDAGVPVRALTHRSEAAATLPANVEVFQQPNPMAVLHADIERLIAAAGLESTIIRPGMFASNALSWWATAIRADGVVRWPYGAAEIAPVDDRHVAAVRRGPCVRTDTLEATTSSPITPPR